MDTGAEAFLPALLLTDYASWAKQVIAILSLSFPRFILGNSSQTCHCGGGGMGETRHQGCQVLAKPRKDWEQSSHLFPGCHRSNRSWSVTFRSDSVSTDTWEEENGGRMGRKARGPKRHTACEPSCVCVGGEGSYQSKCQGRPSRIHSGGLSYPHVAIKWQGLCKCSLLGLGAW